VAIATLRSQRRPWWRTGFRPQTDCFGTRIKSLRFTPPLQLLQRILAWILLKLSPD
jgi:hypothetical protein